MNSRGFMTVDYLFAFFLVAGFSLVVLTFSATLSMVEVVQYMTFASARNYFAGNVSEPAQKNAARRKFAELSNNNVVGPLLHSTWFEISTPENLIVDHNIERYPEFQDYGPTSEISLFHGVVSKFTAKILDFNIPFFGPTKQQNQNFSGFNTNITSFLGREPSFEECESFNRLRWEQIKRLPNRMGAASYATAPGNFYVVINDNGC